MTVDIHMRHASAGRSSGFPRCYWLTLSEGIHSSAAVHLGECDAQVEEKLQEIEAAIDEVRRLVARDEGRTVGAA